MAHLVLVSIKYESVLWSVPCDLGSQKNNEITEIINERNALFREHLQL